MGNHSRNCSICGVDLRDDHAPGCPVRAYDVALEDYQHRQAAYVDMILRPLRDTLQTVEQNIKESWARDNPPPLKPTRK